MAAWAWRSWEFIVALVLIELYPNSLLMVSAYGLLDNLARVVLGPVVGGYIDRHERLPGARAMLRLQNQCIGGSALAALALLWPGTPTATTKAVYWPLMWVLTTLGASSSAGSTGVTITVEREAVKALCGGDSRALARMNSIMRAIDLTALLVAPLVAGLLMTWAGAFAAVAVMSGYCAVAYVPEVLLLGAAFRAAPVLGLPKVRGNTGGAVGSPIVAQRSDGDHGDLNDPRVSERTGLLAAEEDDPATGATGSSDGGMPPSCFARDTPPDAGSGFGPDVPPSPGGKPGELKVSREGSLQRPLLSVQHSGSVADGISPTHDSQFGSESDPRGLLASRNASSRFDGVDSPRPSGMPPPSGTASRGMSRVSSAPAAMAAAPAAAAAAAPAPAPPPSWRRLCRAVLRQAEEYGDSWRVYLRQPMLLLCLALALLYMTVLSLGFLMTSFLKWSGLTEAEVSGYRGIGALAGLAATVVFPTLSARAGLLFCAMAGITYQLVCLAAGVLPVVIAQAEASQGSQGGADDSGSAARPPVGQVRVLVAGVVLSRTGLWLYDLAVTQLIQEGVQPDQMGSVYGVQSSLQASFEMLSFVAGLLSPDPAAFRWLMLGSVGTVAAAATLAWGYVCGRGCKGRVAAASDQAGYKPAGSAPGDAGA